MSDIVTAVASPSRLITRTRRRVMSVVDRATDQVVLVVGRLAALALARHRADMPRVADEDLVKETAELPLTISGKKGETKVVQVRPEEWFKPERFVAYEVAFNTTVRVMGVDAQVLCPPHALNGNSSVITGAYVGAQNVFPTAPYESGGHPVGVATACFGRNAIGGQFSWVPCEVGQSITIHVYFLRDCTWYGTLFGKFDRSGILRKRRWR